MVGKEVVFDDGKFEVTLIKMPKNPLELNEIIAALLVEQVNTNHMYTFRTGAIRFESEEEFRGRLTANLEESMIRWKLKIFSSSFRSWFRQKSCRR